MKETIKLSLPENISDITLEQSKRYFEILQREDIDDEGKIYRVIKVFTGMRFNDIKKLDVSDYEIIVNQINLALNTDVSFIREAYPVAATTGTPKEMYVGIYGDGVGGSEKKAVSYFEKWGWYVSLDRLAGGDPLKIEAVTELPVHAFHIALEHSLDRQKYEASIRNKKPGNNVTEL